VTGVGVAGVGWLGESLMKDIPKVPSFALVGVQDVRADLAREVAKRYGCGWASDSFEALIAQPEVDLIAICTPNALHVPQAQAALRAGKHVLVQKPLALSAADAVATVELAAQLERLLFVDYTYRFLETVQPLRAAQSIRAVRMAFHNIYGPGPEKRWFFDAQTSGGGALIDLGVHLIDLALWLLGPSLVELERADLGAGPIEHAAQLRLWADDVPVDVEVSWNAPRPVTDISVELETDDSPLRWENVAGSFFRFRTRRGERVLLERKTTLREDTLRALAHSLDNGVAPPIDVRVYQLLDQAYGRAPVATLQTTAAPTRDRPHLQAPT
jgi:predicted dehydrogenase